MASSSIAKWQIQEDKEVHLRAFSLELPIITHTLFYYISSLHTTAKSVDGASSTDKIQEEFK